MQMVYQLAPVIADVISAHCPGTGAREEFLRACVHGEWSEAKHLIEGMLAEPWHLRGYQDHASGNSCKSSKSIIHLLLPYSRPEPIGRQSVVLYWPLSRSRSLQGEMPMHVAAILRHKGQRPAPRRPCWQLRTNLRRNA